MVLQDGWGEVKRVLALVFRIRFVIEVRGVQGHQMSLDLLPQRVTALSPFLQAEES